MHLRDFFRVSLEVFLFHFQVNPVDVAFRQLVEIDQMPEPGLVDRVLGVLRRITLVQRFFDFIAQIHEIITRMFPRLFHGGRMAVARNNNLRIKQCQLVEGPHPSAGVAERNPSGSTRTTSLHLGRNA